MLSRDTAVHLAAVAVAIAALFVVSDFTSGFGSTVEQVAVFCLGYGLVLGGAHLVLALRGEGGMVPVSSRWRFLGFVAVVLVLGSVSIATDPVSLGPVSSDAVLSSAGMVALVGYWVLEARDGYRDSTESTSSMN